MKKELELYELVFMFKFDSTDEETNIKIDAYRDFLTEKGSQVMVKNHGKRSLAYPIKGFSTATYIQMVFLGNGSLVNQMNQRIQRDQAVLRSIVTKLAESTLQEVDINEKS